MSKSAQQQSNYLDILTLARAGSTSYALTEYIRLGLDNIRNHEDIMSLHGRLYKDAYLSESGSQARKAARNSAEKYEAAFQDTRGFYSGINAATMSLLAGFDIDMVKMRTRRILDILPPTDTLNRETKYFVEATRAEAQLLLEHEMGAQESFKIAVEHDPLNYVAHASTLKQFHMIARHRGVRYGWLSEFNPPSTVHFAGHIFYAADLDTDQLDDLKMQISEAIQQADIGFGFGSLAAGSDILIAETLLEEGGELHVSLPVAEEDFVRGSVAAFGASWTKRYETCKAKAASFTVVSNFTDWPNSQLDRQAALMSMGAAIRQGDLLSVPSAQLLIWDQNEALSGTSREAREWAKSGRAQHVIPFKGKRVAASQQSTDVVYEFATCVSTSSDRDRQLFRSFNSAITNAIVKRGAQPDIKQGLSLEIGSPQSELSDLSDKLRERAVPGSIMLSELAANYLALNHNGEYAADLMGQLDDGQSVYALRIIG